MSVPHRHPLGVVLFYRGVAHAERADQGTRHHPHQRRLDREALRDAHMSADDLAEDLRQQAVVGPSEVSEARLERNGKLSVIRK